MLSLQQAISYVESQSDTVDETVTIEETSSNEPQWVREIQSIDRDECKYQLISLKCQGARCSSVVRAFAHGAMGCRIDEIQSIDRDECKYQLISLNVRERDVAPW